MIKIFWNIDVIFTGLWNEPIGPLETFLHLTTCTLVCTCHICTYPHRDNIIFFWVCARHNNHKYKINVTEICYFILLRRLTYFVLPRGSFQDSGACKRSYSIRKFIMFFSAFLFKSTQMKRRNCSTLFSFSIIAYFSRACLVYNEGKEWEFSIYGQKSLKFDPSLRALCPILFTFGNVTLTRGFCDAGFLHKI